MGSWDQFWSANLLAPTPLFGNRPSVCKRFVMALTLVVEFHVQNQRFSLFIASVISPVLFGFFSFR